MRAATMLACVQRWWPIHYILACGMVACGEDRSSARHDARELSDVRKSGSIADPLLVEQSGIARSTSSAGVFWSHNDSGNLPQLFALDSTGASRGRWKVAGANNGDWEAIAVGACDTGACVYLADVGDNGARRRSVSIWRVPEPRLPSASALERGEAVRLQTDSAHRLRLRYPDGAHDVEAMWVAPDTSVWLLTKRPHRNAARKFRRALLFRVPSSAWRVSVPTIAELVDSLPLVPLGNNSDRWVTDASFTASGPDGARLAVRTYQEVAIFSADALTGRPLAVVARCSLRSLRERMGEGVAWMPDGRLLFANEGRRSRLWTGRCEHQ